MQKENCSEGTCCSAEAPKPTVDSGCCDLPEKLLHLADEAWFELVKDQIKKEILASCVDSIGKIAKLVAGTNKGRWEHKVQGKVRCEEYKAKIKELFTSCK